MRDCNERRAEIMRILIARRSETQATLAAELGVAVFQTVFGVDTLFVGEKKPVAVCRGADNDVYVLSVGTYLKWETALRKALEHIASMESVAREHVHICLGLVVINDDITTGDKRHIEAALAFIGAKVYFAG